MRDKKKKKKRETFECLGRHVVLLASERVSAEEIKVLRIEACFTAHSFFPQTFRISELFKSLFFLWRNLKRRPTPAQYTIMLHPT